MGKTSLSYFLCCKIQNFLTKNWRKSTLHLDRLCSSAEKKVEIDIIILDLNYLSIINISDDPVYNKQLDVISELCETLSWNDDSCNTGNILRYQKHVYDVCFIINGNKRCGPNFLF